ncbi:MAG: DUF342 domain-containing protein [Desulfovibrionaceae bacterium]|nr:DUF342 domain-containing protein [Desulfovibrionaceae bacterium]
MWYYIRHYFDPDFDYHHLKPVADSKGKVNMRNLNYVQNVVKGQVLAEILPLDHNTSPMPEKRFIMRNPVLPMGANTMVDPKTPHRLLAAQNGFVFYYNRQITIKHLLNVRRSIDMHTGNITFVGDLAVHGDVSSKFELRACNVLVKGIIESAVIRSEGSIVGEGGFKGSQTGKLIADRDVRLAFAETGEIRAGHNIAIDGSCLHCNIFSGANLLVQGRLAGGIIRARHKVYVSHRLGLPGTVLTRVVLGQNPFIYRSIKKLEKEQERLIQKMYNLEALHKKEQEKNGEAAPPSRQYKLVTKKLEVLKHQLAALRPQLNEEHQYKDCMLIVPGEILPGVLVTIGDVSLRIQRPEQNVQICRIGDEIVIQQN